MEILTHVMKASILVFLFSVIAIVTFGLLSGRINLTGLLQDKETHVFSPGRLQLLFFTFGGAIYYFSRILLATDQNALPPVPAELLVIVGGSNLGYLSGKVYSKFFS